jgi:hypothetical protein
MSEQKQSLADFVFENKDKMPDNVYKILMEKYAKEENDRKKGFVEVVYLYPTIVEYREDEYRIEYKKRVAIVKKYDERFKGEEEIKIGLVDYGRVCKNAYCPNDKDNQISVSVEANIVLVKDNRRGYDDEWEVEKGADFFYLTCDEVFVVSVKDL